MESGMKLTKKLLSAGVLGRGEVRHCAEWEFPDGIEAPRIRFVHPVKRIAERRTRRPQRRLFFGGGLMGGKAR